MKKKNWLLSLCLIGAISSANVAFAGCVFKFAWRKFQLVQRIYCIGRRSGYGVA